VGDSCCWRLRGRRFLGKVQGRRIFSFPGKRGPKSLLCWGTSFFGQGFGEVFRSGEKGAKGVADGGKAVKRYAGGLGGGGGEGNLIHGQQLYSGIFGKWDTGGTRHSSRVRRRRSVGKKALKGNDVPGETV